MTVQRMLPHQRLVILCVLLLLALISPSAAPARPASPSTAGPYGLLLDSYLGPAPQIMAVHEPYVYLAAEHELTVLRLDGAAQPVRVSYRFFDSAITKLAADARYLYVATADKAIHILASGSGALLAERGSYVVGAAITALASDGSYLYVGADTLRVIDPANPSAPILLDELEVPLGVRTFTLGQGYLYLMMKPEEYSSTAELWVIVLANPRQLTRVGLLSLLAGGQPGPIDIDVAGTLVGTTSEGGSGYSASLLSFIDVSNPTNPQLMSSTLIQYRSRPLIAMSGGYAYLSFDSGAPIVYDTSNPASPQQVGSLSEPAYNIVAQGGQLYVAGGNGFTSFSLASPTQPQETGRYKSIGRAADLAIQGDRAYIADSDYTVGGLVTLDLSSATAVSIIGRTAIARGSRVVVAGERAYLATTSCSRGGCIQAVVAFDAAGQSAPSKLAVLSTDWGGSNPALLIDTSSTMLVAANRSNRILELFDATQPLTPTLLGSYQTASFITGLAVAGKRAYLALGNSVLEVIDLSIPATPIRLGDYTLANPLGATAIKVVGSTAYVSQGVAGVQLLDISDPANITPVALIDTPGQALDLAVEGGVLYVADGDAGLRIYSLSDPTAPLELNRSAIPGTAQRVAKGPEQIFVIDQAGGLFILRSASTSLYLPLIR